jgi:hypothetical protein
MTTPAESEPSVVLRPRDRFLIGGLGALTPILSNLLLLDYHGIFFNLTLFTVLGVGFKCIVFFLAGGLVIHFFYPDEKQRMKIFQIGLAGPAMIMAMANGARVSNTPPPTTSPAAVNTQNSWLFRGFSGVVYAAAEGPRFKTFAPPRESIVAQVVRGVTGSIPANIYFAIAGSYATAQDAQKALPSVRSVFPNAEIYGPSGGNSYYSIVIASQVTLPDAQGTVRKALVANIRNAYSWRLGSPGILARPAPAGR